MVRTRAREIEKVEGRVRWVMKMCELTGRVVGGKGRRVGRAWGGREARREGGQVPASGGGGRASVLKRTAPRREPGPGNPGDFCKGEITALLGGG